MLQSLPSTAVKENLPFAWSHLPALHVHAWLEADKGLRSLRSPEFFFPFLRDNYIPMRGVLRLPFRTCAWQYSRQFRQLQF